MTEDIKEIYAQADWYLERPEHEVEMRGMLQRRKVPLGPNTRSAVSFMLIENEREIPVYAATMEQRLTPFVGRRVLATGKLVDLSSEGYSTEFWPASITAKELKMDHNSGTTPNQR
jgi:hypothetical protein